MKRNLAIDSGGTKIIAILYDEEFHRISSCRVGSVRANTTSQELVQKNAKELIRKLGLDKPENQRLDRVCGIVDSSVEKMLKESCEIREKDSNGEVDLGLSAAGIFGDGLLALAGTGATVFGRYQGSYYIAGGYGAVVSDVGSGYWMGRCAMEAAIADFEGWGEKTLLTQMIMEHFGNKDLREAIFTIYADKDVSPAASVAQCAPLVCQAAKRNDAVAVDIVHKVGKILGKQMIALVDKNHIPEEVPITISGSVWRGHPEIFARFKEVILCHLPERKIIIPEFEPVIGAIIRHYSLINGKFDEEVKERFRKEYVEYTWSIEAECSKK